MGETTKGAKRVRLVCPECQEGEFWLIQVDHNEPGIDRDGFEMHCKKCETVLYGTGLSVVLETARQRGRESLALDMRRLLDVKEGPGPLPRHSLQTSENVVD